MKIKAKHHRNETTKNFQKKKDMAIAFCPFFLSRITKTSSPPSCKLLNETCKMQSRLLQFKTIKAVVKGLSIEKTIAQEYGTRIQLKRFLSDDDQTNYDLKSSWTVYIIEKGSLLSYTKICSMASKSVVSLGLSWLASPVKCVCLNCQWTWRQFQ